MYEIIKILSLPPFSLVAVIAIGLALIVIGRRRFGLTIAWMSIAVFYLLSIDLVSSRLTRLIEDVPVLTPTAVSAIEADAIVVLGASANPFSLEFGKPTAGFRSLFRLRYAAQLHRQTGLPILVSGGKTSRLPESLGRILATDLEQSFQVPVQWVEDRSLNTFENAENSAEILKSAGVKTAFLVTEAFHMRRAIKAFGGTDLTVIAAPTGRRPLAPIDLRSFLPTLNSMADSHFAFHELIGRVWYALRYGT